MNFKNHLEDIYKQKSDELTAIYNTEIEKIKQEHHCKIVDLETDITEKSRKKNEKLEKETIQSLKDVDNKELLILKENIFNELITLTAKDIVKKDILLNKSYLKAVNKIIDNNKNSKIFVSDKRLKNEIKTKTIHKSGMTGVQIIKENICYNITLESFCEANSEKIYQLIEEDLFEKC